MSMSIELFTAINNKIPAKSANERGILFVIATCGDGFQLSMKTIMDRLGIKNKQNYYAARESLIRKGFLIYDEEANTLEINYDLLLDTTESNLMSHVEHDSKGHVEHDYNIKRIEKNIKYKTSSASARSFINDVPFDF